MSAIKYFLDHNWKDIRNDMRLVKQLLTWVKGELRSTANYESASYNLEKLLSTNVRAYSVKVDARCTLGGLSGQLDEHAASRLPCIAHVTFHRSPA